MSDAPGGETGRGAGPRRPEGAPASRHRKRRRMQRGLLGLLPRRKQLRNTWLHRTVGERLFAHELWVPEKRAVAGGLAVGAFVAMTPTLGVQMILAGLLAVAFRVNLPLAVGACWITNPATAPFIYKGLHRLGRWLGDPLPPEQLEGLGHFRTFMEHAKPLWLGSLVVGVFVAGTVYAIVLLAWTTLARHVVPSLRHHASDTGEHHAVGPDGEVVASDDERDDDPGGEAGGDGRSDDDRPPVATA